MTSILKKRAEARARRAEKGIREPGRPRSGQKPIDWAGAEVDYRAGMTLQAVANKYGASTSAVHQHAVAGGWSHDLTARIKARTEAKLAREALDKEQRERFKEINAENRAAADLAIIDASAELQAGVITSHRKDIAQLRRTILSMSGELEAMGAEEIQEALKIVLDERCDGQSATYKRALNKALDAAMELGNRSQIGRQLVMSLSALIDKEREAYGLDRNAETGKESLAEFLKTLD